MPSCVRAVTSPILGFALIYRLSGGKKPIYFPCKTPESLLDLNAVLLSCSQCSLRTRRRLSGNVDRRRQYRITRAPKISLRFRSPSRHGASQEQSLPNVRSELSCSISSLTDRIYHLRYFLSLLAIPYLSLTIRNLPGRSVHDGWGHSDIEKGNAIFAGTTENMDKLGKDGHLRYISAHGLNVGLNDGLMGNSEVGYVIYPFDYVVYRKCAEY
jgi:hypothetical protein